MTDPLDRLAELMERAEGSSAYRRRAEGRVSPWQYDLACHAEDNDARELHKALRNAAPQLVAIARAAREVVARSGELDCYTPLAGAIDELNAQLALLTPTQPQGERR